MSTKIYNAYKLEGDYNLTSLNEFCNNLRKEVTKISEQMILDWIVNKTLYYYNFKKLHGSQAVQNMIMQTKNFKEMQYLRYGFGTESSKSKKKGDHSYLSIAG